MIDFFSRLEDVGKGQIFRGLWSSPSTTSDHYINEGCTITGNFFSNFSCMFLNPNIFFSIWFLIVLIYSNLINLHEQVKGGISFPKLFQLIVRKKCSSKILSWSLIVCKKMRSLEQFIWRVNLRPIFETEWFFYLFLPFVI